MPLNEFFDLRSTSDNESKYMSFKPETVIPVVSIECLYCNQETIACKMDHPCSFKDPLRFCNLPKERMDTQSGEGFIVHSKILNKEIQIDCIEKTATMLKKEIPNQH